MATRKFCFVCGNSAGKNIDGYCEDCYAKKEPLVEVPDKKFELIACSKCKKINVKSVWQTVAVEDILEKKVKPKGRLLKLEIQPEGKKFFVYAKGYPHGSKKLKEERVLMPAHINRIVCPNCSRRFCGYYEAIIQIRGDFEDNVLLFIEDSVEEVTANYDKGFITKVERVVGGFDYYMGSKNLACKISENIKKKFNAEIKKSYKLVTEIDGQEIYRTIISVRI